MRSWAIAFHLAAVISIAGFTAAAHSLAPQQEEPGPELVQVFSQGSDVTAPELLPAPNPLVVPDNCKGKINSEIHFAAIIDLQGSPRNITFLSATGNDLDKFALLMLDRERFKPATRNNHPVVVAQAVTIKFETCHTDSTSVDGTPATYLHLRSKPELTLTPLPDPPKQVILGPTVDQNLARNYQSAHFDQVGQQKYGSNITEPKLLLYTEAKFSDEARRKSIEGTCVLGLIVDSNGMPQNIRVRRSVGSGLDEKAVEAVRQYRFRPALANGSPVAVPISIQVNFRLYRKP